MGGLFDINTLSRHPLLRQGSTLSLTPTWILVRAGMKSIMINGMTQISPKD